MLAIHRDCSLVGFSGKYIYMSYRSHIYEASSEQLPSFAACWAFPKAQPYQVTADLSMRKQRQLLDSGAVQKTGIRK